MKNGWGRHTPPGWVFYDFIKSFKFCHCGRRCMPPLLQEKWHPIQCLPRNVFFAWFQHGQADLHIVLGLSRIFQSDAHVPLCSRCLVIGWHARISWLVPLYAKPIRLLLEYHNQIINKWNIIQIRGPEQKAPARKKWSGSKARSLWPPACFLSERKFSSTRSDGDAIAWCEGLFWFYPFLYSWITNILSLFFFFTRSSRLFF